MTSNSIHAPDRAHVAASMRSGHAEWLMTNKGLDAARANLGAALHEEGEALANACEAVKTGGAASAEAAGAMRSAQSAHARSYAAVVEVRALNVEADRLRAAAEGPALAPEPGRQEPGGRAADPSSP